MQDSPLSEADQIRKIHALCAEREAWVVSDRRARPRWFRYFQGKGVVAAVVMEFLSALGMVSASASISGNTLIWILFPLYGVSGLSSLYLLIHLTVDIWHEWRDIREIANPFSVGDSDQLERDLDHTAKLTLFPRESLERVALWLETRSARTQNHLNWFKGMGGMLATFGIILIPHSPVVTWLGTHLPQGWLLIVQLVAAFFLSLLILMLSAFWRFSSNSTNRALYLRRILKEQELFRENALPSVPST
jgi:hypothetical protein